MAKKAQGGFRAIVGAFFNALSGGLLSRVREMVSDVTETVQERVYETLRRLIRELIVAVFAIIASVFVLLGITFFLNERLIESKGLSFLIVGLILLVAVLLYRSTIPQKSRR